MQTIYKSLVFGALLSVTIVTAVAKEKGGFGSGLSGGSGGSASTESDIYRCSEPMGHLVIRDRSEDRYRNQYSSALGTDSITTILREAVAASNCFVIVAAADDAINKDLDKIFADQKNSARTRPGSEHQDGQAQAADYAMYPTVIFKEQESGSKGGGLGGLIPLKKIPIIGAGMAKTNIKSSEVALEIWSIRSRTRLAGAVAEGKVSNFSMTALGVPGIPAGGAFQSAEKSPEGKATLKAMLNAYNELVVNLQNYEKQVAKKGGSGGLLE
jgi:curli biogenesis system outer membrane secretion channel CsgG